MIKGEGAGCLMMKRRGAPNWSKSARMGQSEVGDNQRGAHSVAKWFDEDFGVAEGRV